MQYRANKRRSSVRSKGGSIMPMVAFGLLFIFAFLAFVIDVMRETLAIEQIRFAARAAIVHVLPYASLDADGQVQNNPLRNADGSFTSEALASMQAALAEANGSNNGGTAWNSAITNPDEDGAPWLSPVLFDASKLQSANNTSDPSDPIVQIEVNRSGADAMNFLFLPVRYAADLISGGSLPDQLFAADISQRTEAYTQPAIRIGAAPPANSSTSKAQAIARARLACFPVAINYEDFKRLIAQQKNGSCRLLINGPQASQMQANSDLRSYFVNLKSGGNVGGYYCDAQTQASLNNLIGLLEYFSATSSGPQALELPSSVERNVNLDRFDSVLYSGNADLGQVIAAIPTQKCYIFPVVKDGGSSTSQCEVLGFALLRIDAVLSQTNTWILNCSLGESVPVLNATCSPGYKTLPSFDGTRLQALPDGNACPFAARSYDSSNQTFTPRVPGVVMAPVLSCRKIDSQI